MCARYSSLKRRQSGEILGYVLEMFQCGRIYGLVVEEGTSCFRGYTYLARGILIAVLGLVY